MTIAYIVALFLFALIVGQMRNIIGSLSTKQDAFLIVLDSTTKYCKSLNLPDKIIRKVVLWFDYYAKQQDDSMILFTINFCSNFSFEFYMNFQVPFEAIDFLPINVQADLAIAVYLDLLSKVKLFQVNYNFKNIC